MFMFSFVQPVKRGKEITILIWIKILEEQKTGFISVYTVQIHYLMQPQLLLVHQFLDKVCHKQHPGHHQHQWKDKRDGLLVPGKERRSNWLQCCEQCCDSHMKSGEQKCSGFLFFKPNFPRNHIRHWILGHQSVEDWGQLYLTVCSGGWLLMLQCSTNTGVTAWCDLLCCIVCRSDIQCIMDRVLYRHYQSCLSMCICKVRVGIHPHSVEPKWMTRRLSVTANRQFSTSR